MRGAARQDESFAGGTHGSIPEAAPVGVPERGAGHWALPRRGGARSEGCALLFRYQRIDTLSMLMPNRPSTTFATPSRAPGSARRPDSLSRVDSGPAPATPRRHTEDCPDGVSAPATAPATVRPSAGTEATAAIRGEAQGVGGCPSRPSAIAFRNARSGRRMAASERPRRATKSESFGKDERRAMIVSAKGPSVSTPGTGRCLEVGRQRVSRDGVLRENSRVAT